MSSCSHIDYISTIVVLFWKEHNLTLNSHLPKSSPSSDGSNYLDAMVLVISMQWFQLFLAFFSMQPSMVSIFFLDTKVKQAFNTPLHKFNANFSAFGRSSHIINLAQDEHMSLRSFTRSCTKHTKKRTSNQKKDHVQVRHQSRISKGRFFQRIKSLKDMHQDHACKQANKEKKKKSKQIITKKRIVIFPSLHF